MTSLKDLKKKWTKNPDFAAEYEALAPEFAIAGALIRARTQAGMTQAEVAEKMDVTQSRVAKMEGGINVSVEATPQEVREVLGLPDLGKVHKAVLDKMADKVADGDVDMGSMMEILVPTQLRELGKNFFKTAMDSAKKSGGKSGKE